MKPITKAFIQKRLAKVRQHDMWIITDALEILGLPAHECENFRADWFKSNTGRDC